jgi:hypothetical protein
MDSSAGRPQAKGFPAGYTQATSSTGRTQVVQPGGTPEKSRSAQLSGSASRSDNGVFNRAKRFASGLFNRFFN